MLTSEYSYEKDILVKQQEAREDAWEKGMEKTLLESIQNLVEALKITTTQAMNILKVPEQNREKYLKMLNK